MRFFLFLLLSLLGLAASSIPGCSIGSVDYSALADILDLLGASVDEPPNSSSYTYFVSLCRPLTFNLACVIGEPNSAICRTGVGNNFIEGVYDWQNGAHSQLEYLDSANPSAGIRMIYQNSQGLNIAGIEVSCSAKEDSPLYPPPMEVKVVNETYRIFQSASHRACVPKGREQQENQPRRINAQWAES